MLPHRGARDFRAPFGRAEALGVGSKLLTDYRDMFGLDVMPTSADKWSVAVLLEPEPWTNIVLSARAATRQIPVAEIAALGLGDMTNVTVKGCVPGFYYSFYSGSTVTNVRAIASDEGRNVLCGPSQEVNFSVVAKLSDAAGFFTIGVSATK